MACLRQSRFAAAAAQGRPMSPPFHVHPSSFDAEPGGSQRAGASRPSPELDGLVALLVTDLEGFTPLVERLGDQRARQLIHVHDRILRDCVRVRGGVEVAHTGDGVLVAFRSALRALRCASDMQLALREHNQSNPERTLRVRIGMHAGEPLPEAGRLFGCSVVTAVRVCSAARAQSVLVSTLVRDLATGSGFRFLARGAFELKGLTPAMELHELVWS